MNGEGGFVMRNVLMAFVTLTLTLSVAFASYAMDGWRQQEGGWYYYQNEQRLADQWINENGDTYYLGPDGRMLTGNHLIDGYLYSFMSDGKLFKYTGTDVWRDHKVITTDGRGVLAMWPGSLNWEPRTWCSFPALRIPYRICCGCARMAWRRLC